MTPVRVGVAGLGYWGPNLARVFESLPQAELRWLCDAKPEIRLTLKPRYPHARLTGEFAEMVSDDGLDAVVIATPSSTHYELALEALQAGKHVFVEKPLALSAADASHLVAVAEEYRLCLMVGHVMLFHPAIRKLKELVDRGELGDLFYLYANRQNLGKVRSDESALWSLGSHDIAVLLYLLDEQPVEVSARGEAYVQPGIADVVFCYLRFASGVTAHLHLSWLDPHKLRRLTVVGSQRMAVVDDMEPERKLTLYEKSVTPRPTGEFGEYVQVRFGDIVIPRLPPIEPLRVECEHFVSSVRSSAVRATRAREAASVVEVIEALQCSLENGGRSEQLGPRPVEDLRSLAGL